MSEPVYMSQESLAEPSNLDAQLPQVGRASFRSNHRDIQPLFGRPVYFSFNASDTSTYELTAQAKRPAGRRSQLESAFGEYWQRAKSLKVSVKKGCKAIE